MQRAILGGSLGVLLASGAGAQEPLNLSLSCPGSAVMIVEESSDNGTIGDLSDDESMTRRTNASGRVRLRFSPTDSAVSFPSTMGGGADRWIKLTSVVHDDDRISAEYKRLIFKTRIVVDRRTGDIEITGPRFSFSGSCEKAPAESEARKF